MATARNPARHPALTNSPGFRLVNVHAYLPRSSALIGRVERGLSAEFWPLTAVAYNHKYKYMGTGAGDGLKRGHIREPFALPALRMGPYR